MNHRVTYFYFAHVTVTSWEPIGKGKNLPPGPRFSPPSPLNGGKSFDPFLSLLSLCSHLNPFLSDPKGRIKT
jgi:hypothetical protein